MALASPKLLEPGVEGRQRVDRFELVAEIASGGMATVFLARLSGMGGFQRFVAIKRLHPHLAREAEFVQMFLDEARLAAGIHHPNVVPILEVGASEHGYYLVMEYIEGDTLARLLARAATAGHKLPLHVGIRVVLDMLRGLHAAHELKDEKGQPTGLVHRDVSPQNVLVGVDGTSRITDFGVARAATRLSATRVGQLKGKIAYMSPEQASGDQDVDRRADVFSAGVVLWEVLAGRRLFKAETEAQTLSRVMNEVIPIPRDVAPDVSAAVSHVCMIALARNPDRRYLDCNEFADALEGAAEGASVLASTRDVATHVSEVLGDEISQQRDAVRAWLARSEPSQAMRPVMEDAPLAGPTLASSMSAGAMELSRASLPGGSDARRRPKVSLALGVAAVLLLLGSATAAMLLARKPAEPAEPAAAPSAHEPAALGSAPATPQSPTPAASASDVTPVEALEAAPPPSRERHEEKPRERSKEKDENSKAGEKSSKAEPAPPPAPPVAAPEPVRLEPEKPKPKPKRPDVDLSNPYR